MSFLSSLDIGGSALTAQRFRMDIISQNIANRETTRTEGGGAYVRKMVVLEARESTAFANVLNDKISSTGNGVRVAEVAEDTSAMKQVYDPTNVDADENGYVEYPNIDNVKEMVDLMSASRSYEANVTAINAVKQMAAKALEIGR